MGRLDVTDARGEKFVALDHSKRKNVKGVSFTREMRSVKGVSFT